MARTGIDKSRFPVAVLSVIEAERHILHFTCKEDLAIGMPPQIVDSLDFSDLLSVIPIR